MTKEGNGRKRFSGRTAPPYSVVDNGGGKTPSLLFKTRRFQELHEAEAGLHKRRIFSAEADHILSQ